MDRAEGDVADDDEGGVDEARRALETIDEATEPRIGTAQGFGVLARSVAVGREDARRLDEADQPDGGIALGLGDAAGDLDEGRIPLARGRPARRTPLAARWPGLRRFEVLRRDRLERRHERRARAPPHEIEPGLGFIIRDGVGHEQLDARAIGRGPAQREGPASQRRVPERRRLEQPAVPEGQRAIALRRQPLVGDDSVAVGAKAGDERRMRGVARAGRWAAPPGRRSSPRPRAPPGTACESDHRAPPRTRTARENRPPRGPPPSRAPPGAGSPPRAAPASRVASCSDRRFPGEGLAQARARRRATPDQNAIRPQSRSPSPRRARARP